MAGEKPCLLFSHSVQSRGDVQCFSIKYVIWNAAGCPNQVVFLHLLFRSPLGLTVETFGNVTDHRQPLPTESFMPRFQHVRCRIVHWRSVLQVLLRSQ